MLTTTSIETSLVNEEWEEQTSIMSTIFIIQWVFYGLLAIITIAFAIRKANKDKAGLGEITELKEFAKQNFRGQLWCGCHLGSLIGFLSLTLIPLTVFDYDTIVNSQSTQCTITSVKYCTICVCYSSQGKPGYKYDYRMVQTNGEPFDNGCVSILYKDDICDTDGADYYKGDTVDCMVHLNEYNQCSGEFGNSTDIYSVTIAMEIIGFVFYWCVLLAFYKGFTIWKNIGIYCLTDWGAIVTPAMKRDIKRRQERLEMHEIINHDNMPEQIKNKKTTNNQTKEAPKTMFIDSSS